MAELKSTIGRLIKNATQDENSDTRAKLFDQYMGEPYGDERTGKSGFVSTDISDSVEAIFPDLMEVFTGAENIAVFNAQGPEDEDAARQESDVVEHMFWQRNPGFEILSTWIKESLIQQNSYVRFGWVEKERVSIEEYEDLTVAEIAQIDAEIEGEVEILEKAERQEQRADPETGGLILETLYDLKLRVVTKDKAYEIEAIPQEEFFHSPQWNKPSLIGVPCCGHRREIERGELLSMGFSAESIDKGTKESEGAQTQERHDTQYHHGVEDEDGDDSTRPVMVYEAYLRADANGDGRAELLKVWAVGDGSEVLQWENGDDAIEEVSSLPFACLSPYLVPHRHVGRAVAEIVSSLQRVKTILYRHTFDNLYATNFPRPYYDETNAGANLAGDLMNPAPGAEVRTGGALVQWHAPQSVIGTTLPLIGKMDDLQESRTGASRYNQGLDPDSLNKTASGITQIMSASMKKIKMIARTMAETGIADLWRGIHRDLRSGPAKEMAIKLRGEWVSVNPREWKHRTDMTVGVGIGRGDKLEKRQGYMLIGQLQRELMQANSGMVDEAKIYETAERVAETFGIESITPFLNDPRKLPPKQEQPNPAMMLAQAQMQKLQADTQIAANESARKAKETDARIAHEARKLEFEYQRFLAEMQIKGAAEQRQQAKAASDIQTDEERLDLDRDKAVMADDLERDKLGGWTGAASVPPMSYGDILE